MVMAIPFLHALRQHAQDEIWAMGKESAIHLYNGLGLFDRFVPIRGKGLGLFFETTNRLNKVGFARAIALPHSFRSALFFFNLRVRDVIGYARNRRGFMLRQRSFNQPSNITSGSRTRSECPGRSKRLSLPCRPTRRRNSTRSSPT
jgi:ADP-heptose:LPS heptosyltransferase